MPKKSEATGATAAGLEGIVMDANNRQWELDPERDVDGELIGSPASDANEAAPRSGSKSSAVVEDAPDEREDESVAPTGTSTRSQSPNTAKRNR